MWSSRGLAVAWRRVHRINNYSSSDDEEKAHQQNPRAVTRPPSSASFQLGPGTSWQMKKDRVEQWCKAGCKTMVLLPAAPGSHPQFADLNVLCAGSSYILTHPHIMWPVFARLVRVREHETSFGFVGLFDARLMTCAQACKQKKPENLMHTDWRCTCLSAIFPQLKSTKLSQMPH